MDKFFEDILQSGFRRKFLKEEYLFYRGDVGNTFYIIESGKVELSIFNIDGEKIILTELKKGDFFGQIEVFTNGIRLTNAYVYPGTRLVSFSAQVFNNFIANNGDRSLELIKILCSIIDKGLNKIEDILILTAHQKVSKKLYEISQSSQTRWIEISQKKISEHLAISERTTNVALKKLKKNGAIFLRRSKIEILDPDILKNEFTSKRSAY